MERGHVFRCSNSNFFLSTTKDLTPSWLFPLDKDLPTACRAKATSRKGVVFLKDFPFSCRKSTSENPFLREMLISFCNSGYVVLFETENKATVTILAIRHQRESDYH